jgi:glucose dehydrogenase
MRPVSQRQQRSVPVRSPRLAGPRRRRIPARLERHDGVRRRQQPPLELQGQGLTGISPAVPYNKGTGEVVAVDEATGKIRWDHKLPSSAYGAATIANNVVFTTTFNGTLHAFNASTGAELWHTALS